LDRYATGLREGMRVERGNIIGFVGSTGNADPRAPHLHFAIFELEREKLWWRGKAVDPYPGLVAAVKRAKQRTIFAGSVQRPRPNNTVLTVFSRMAASQRKDLCLA
jgi:murein DD-endopeptidase MepM/ murein hydrolase activator NlpD